MELSPALVALLVVGPTLIAAAAAGVWHWLSERNSRARRVFVAMETGDTFEGVLVRRLPDRLILDAAKLHRDGSETSLDGTVELDRQRITWVQVP